jgi:hypothetical protein
LLDTNGLEHIENYPFPVYATPGGAAQARRVADRTQRAARWLAKTVELAPQPPLLVVGEQDWGRIALIPQYGLAHVCRDRMVVGLESGQLWFTLLDKIWPALSEEAQEKMNAVYGRPAHLGAFEELLSVHELTHLADNPAHLDPESPGSEKFWGNNPFVLWFVELFANLGLHGYVHECEPEKVPALETLFTCAWSTPVDLWPVREFPSMLEAMTSPGMDGTNYAWLEHRLQVVAKILWDDAGTQALRAMSEVLHGPILAYPDIVDFLAELSAEAAEMIHNWPGAAGVR